MSQMSFCSFSYSYAFIDLKDNYGKATGHFEFNFTIQLPSDFYFYFKLSDEVGNQLDEAYSYHSFIKQG